METYPLTSMTLDEAKQQQFALIDAITRHFNGLAFLTLGDLGLHAGLNQPQTTQQVERVLADFFQAQSAVLVQGAGTGALRSGLAALLKPGQRLLVHQAPIYPTTAVSIEQMGLVVQYADFNYLPAVAQALQSSPPDAVLIQHTRQQPADAYHLAEVLALCQQQGILTLIDDNYAALKVPKIGCQLGATLSTFSSFKLLGPVGIGVVVGQGETVKAIRQTLYSGGCQVQGYQALEVLRGMVFAPVMQAIQAEVNEQLVRRLNQGELPFVKQACLANAQSKVLLVEFHQPIAQALLVEAEKLGALPHPIGAESKFELPPLFYRLSGTFRAADPGCEQRMIRINPNRSGADTVLRILAQSYQNMAKEPHE